MFAGRCRKFAEICDGQLVVFYFSEVDLAWRCGGAAALRQWARQRLARSITVKCNNYK